MKMKKWLIGGLFILLLGGFGFYYFSPPKAFYTQEQLLTVLKNYPDKQYRAEKIDDIIFLNDRHVFVPYTNHENLPGILLFKWEKRDWHVVGGSINMPKHLWQLDTTNSSTTYVLWHHNFKEAVNFQVKLERIGGWRTSDGVTIYSPRIHMTHEITDAPNYGVHQISDEWAAVTTPSIKPSFLQSFLGYNVDYSYQFSAKFLNDRQEEVYLEGNGGGFGNGDTNMLHQIL